MKTGNGEQGSGLRSCACGRPLWRQSDAECSICEREKRRPAPWPAPEIRACEVEGCNGMSYGSRYCERCESEISALRDMARLKDERREQRRARRAARRTFAGVCKAVYNRLWIVNLVFVLGVIVYLAGVYGYAFIEWLQLGGWQ